MKRVLLLLAVVTAFVSNAQLNESFTDGNFSAAPAWNGTTSTWLVVADSDVGTGATGSSTLRLNAASGTSGTEYLSTQLSGSWGASQSWGFWIGRRSQEATASNTSYVWLFANESDVTSGTVDGYRIRFGNNGPGVDRIVLEVVTNGVGTAIITSTGGTADGITDFGFLVRVTRSATGEWALFTSTLPTTNGTGATATAVPNATNANVAQGTVTNTTYTTFDNGRIAFAALHTTSAGARAGAEFDQLIFSFVAAGTLPVKFSNLKATQTSRGINLQWSNMTESDVVDYTLERSSNGRNFTSVAQFNPSANNGGKADYQYMDASPLSGTSFYRIKAVETNGKTTYSDLARISIGGRNTLVNLYPNPVKGNILGLQIDNLPAGKYSIRIYNSSAQAVTNQSLDHEGGSVSQTVSLNNLKAGIYTFEISGVIKLQKQFIIE